MSRGVASDWWGGGVNGDEILIVGSQVKIGCLRWAVDLLKHTREARNTPVKPHRRGGRVLVHRVSFEARVWASRLAKRPPTEQTSVVREEV